MSADLLERVRSVIARYLQIPVEGVRADTKLEDLGLDSLGSLELIFELEEVFQVVVPNERVSDFATVRQVCEGIEGLQRVGAPAG